ncbi:hypothetical protein SPBR_01258 [Sporothrix brasiliensis 5110]|uniref:DNA mismatch repair proteins mutS family domain-containing protein n=1 Tax=Sporothrix brasiliensis 5110 TaxID=1398154 RepID=A0A0C2ISD8_9PEZI|nr:uncharacterized protein SPBR_01258 [Sporothrix brasiliensis 5110]KIH91946.1 hypothetical protein SPBR_01258 [Sporothrix brasiliensis 5110]
MYSEKTAHRGLAGSSQPSVRSFTTPTSSRWAAINTRNALNPPSAYNPPSTLQGRGTGSGVGSGRASGTISRPGGTDQRPPFPIGPDENRGVVCAVCDSNNVNRAVGLAFVNVPIAEAVLTTVADTQYYQGTIHKIQMMEVSRILMQPTQASSVQSGLALRPHIEEELRGLPIVERAKPAWSADDGMLALQRVAFTEDLPSLEVAVKDNFHLLCAFSAAMKFLTDDMGIDFDDHSVRIKYQPPSDAMMISLPTIRSLELIQNAINSRSKDCLYGLLNRTTTPMGSRVLRSNILQPSTLAAVLNPRYEAVGELAHKDGLLDKVVEDGSIYESEQAINNILKLKAFLTAIPQVFESLSDVSCDLLLEIRSNCLPARADRILGIIGDTIDRDAAYATKPLELRNQRVHTVKPEISVSLDIQRKLYEDFSRKIHDYVNDLEDEIRVKVALKYTATRKFYLKVNAKDFGPQGPPPVLVNTKPVKGAIECQTLKLIGYNERINEAVHRAIVESDEVIKSLLSQIRPRVSTLFKYCECIALLDLLASFATSTRTYTYKRPLIHTDSYALVGGRHPILDSRGHNKCIPNDYFVTEETRFQIITGQNMSGKSTYIRSIAMLQIMAQIGCYIPAESNQSTFSIEMREMAFILRNVNNKSLVIVDELGRSTSTQDGLAIAAAMSEALLQSNATVYFATHFSELAKALAINIGVVNRHLRTVTEYSESATHVPVMNMLYRVAEGPEPEVSYGIALAKAVGFPATFIAHAEKVAAELRAEAQASKRDRQEMEEAKRRKLVANLVRQLKLAYVSDAGDEELAEYLTQIYDDFCARMIGSIDDEDAIVEEDGNENECDDDGDGEHNGAEENMARVARKGQYAVRKPSDLGLFGGGTDDDVDDVDDVDDDYDDLYRPGSAANAIVIEDDEEFDEDHMSDMEDIGNDSDEEMY